MVWPNCERYGSLKYKSCVEDAMFCMWFKEKVVRWVSIFQGGDTRELGRRIIPPSTRQHHTDKDYLKHHARETIGYEYCPMTATTYRGQPTQHPPQHRRFPKIHKEPTSGCITLPTQTSGWFKDEKLHKTSTQVLADSQEPYLKHNPWKFSYHGVSKCYPRYNEPQKSQHPYPVWVVQGTQDNLKL